LYTPFKVSAGKQRNNSATGEGVRIRDGPLFSHKGHLLGISVQSIKISAKERRKTFQLVKGPNLKGIKKADKIVRTL
jgi:hypothetical protein